MSKQKKKENTIELLDIIIKGIQEVKGENITILDLRDLPHTISDYFVVCDANSNTQVKAIARSIEKMTKELLDDRPQHVEGKENSLWVLMDYTDIIVHIFYKETREKYRIEDLWGDANIRKIEARA